MRVPTLLLVSTGFVANVAIAQTSATTPGASGYHLAATWKPGGEGGWDYLSADAPAHRLYVTRPDRVQVIDTESGARIGEVPGLDGGHGVALATECNRGFASSGKSNTVVVFDLTTLKAIGEPLAVGKKPDAIIYDPASKHVFAFEGGSAAVSVIDAASATVVATIPLGGAPEFAAADGQGMVYVNLEDKSEVLAIDTRKNVVTQRWPLAPGESPSGLALDAVHHRLFAGCHNGKMVVLDAGNGKVLGTPSIGQGVDACAFDPGTGFALASCGDGTLTVIKEDPAGSFSVLAQLPTKLDARTMALNPLTHALYFAVADFEPAALAPGDKRVRPRMIPGTFAVLKFDR